MLQVLEWTQSRTWSVPFSGIVEIIRIKSLFSSNRMYQPLIVDSLFILSGRSNRSSQLMELVTSTGAPASEEEVHVEITRHSWVLFCGWAFLSNSSRIFL